MLDQHDQRRDPGQLRVDPLAQNVGDGFPVAEQHRPEPSEPAIGISFGHGRPLP